DIAHAAGSQAKPLTDDRLEAKLTAAATRAGFPGDTRALMDALWQIDSAEDAGAIIALAGA
ncbi:MAG: MmgE/PrpD family protein, partial [Pseudomonadota bacterium]|nr:MmgE/PrpD family protein [Pseudomonadota bacterium]